jgi:hypothetical protein
MVENERDEIDDFLEEDTGSVPQRRRPPRTESASPPTFSTVMAIIDLIFATLRLPVLLFSLLAVVALFQNPNLQHLAIPSAVSVLAEGLMAVCGLAAGIGILMKKPWAVLPGWIAAGGALVSIGLNVYTTLQTLDQNLAMFQGQQAEAARIGAYGGLVGTIVFRVGLLIAYIVALSMYSKWIAARKS